MSDEVDVNIIGSGPNGLAAAVTLARAGLSVRVYERADAFGGGARTAELTLPGFRHDICSAVHPQALASPFFRAFELEKRVSFVVPDASYAHPLDGGRAGVAWRDLDRAAAGLGVDGGAWQRLLTPLVREVDAITDFAGSSLLRWPRHPFVDARFGLRALEQGSRLWGARFRGEVAPALLTGVAAHASASLPSLAAAGAGLVLAMHGHARGWGIPLGGSQSIADALAADLRARGGEIVTGFAVKALRDLPPARATLFDTSPRALLRIVEAAGVRGAVSAEVPVAYRQRLERFHYGSGVAKVDFAVSDPIPWANPDVAAAAAVHLGGRREEIARAEREVARGRHAAHPFTLVSQPTLFDPTRAPARRHVVWAYAHVPHGSTLDATETITRQIERYAPGFRDTILASAAMSAAQLAEHNPNNVGGEISGGAVSLTQLLRRPVVSNDPWRTPIDGVYLCSASSVPGPSVHGMNGWFAARSALAHTFGIRRMPPLGLGD
ncbi:phytoene desaturase family protein [Rathayibacter soli]|uniref:phytoene desaturase family protein n=1 Tax=Rathayibacter soli TaxID=3144168 RepID=UPI0027E518DD|nr:NAD(P)/FAD-dependent oxidoreductase [Glaciibacter superstes]